MRLKLLLVVASVFVTSLMVHAADDTGVAAELEQIERMRVRALVEADMAIARRLHADDFQLINPGGGALSKAEYLGGIESGFLDYLTWEPGAVEVKVYGNAAALRYKSQLEIVVGGQKTTLRPFWHTDVYEKRNGQWQVVWSHATEVQQPTQ